MTLAIWSSLMAGLAVVVYLGLALGGARMSAFPRSLLWVLAWWLHGLSIVGVLFDSPAHFGFGPALSATAWMVLCVYAVESRALPKLQSQSALLALAALAVLVALWFPGSPLPITTTLWQPLHWVLGITSYGLFAAAVIHGLLTSEAERRIRLAQETRGGLPVLTLERLTFHLVTAGFIALTLTLALGFVDRVAIGGAWRWDHKTVLSLLSWLIFGVLVAGRYFAGWRGPKALRFLYVGAACLFLAYVGSHFIREIILQR
jgi:ABC-type uncharacterized transport system permease subunit